MIVGRNYQKVFDYVLKEIKPTVAETDSEKKFIGEIIKRLDEMTPSDIRIELAGSTAKGTNLKGDRDFDVFMLFPKDYSVNELMTLGIKYAKEFAKGHSYEIAYAEHPYLRVWVKGSKIDIVPSYKIDDVSQRLTSVDRSPLHTKFINESMTTEQKDDTRILKKFLKGIGIYGAEGKIRGFSGYMCELLILKYGTFLNLLDSASKWKGVPVLDIMNVSEENDLRNKFKDAALIFIDPIDKDRNVAAAVSKTSLSLLIHSSRMFLAKPSSNAFFPPSNKPDKVWVEKQLKLRDSLIVGVEFSRPKKIVDDILWPQLYKFATKSTDRMRESEFEVFDTDICANGKCMIMFELSVYQLPEMKRIVGPPLWHDRDVNEFIRRHKVTEPIWFENDRILAVGKRRFTKAESLIRDILKRPNEYGVPPNIKKVIKTSKLIGISDIKRRYPEFLFSYLKKRNVP